MGDRTVNELIQPKDAFELNIWPPTSTSRIHPPFTSQLYLESRGKNVQQFHGRMRAQWYWSWNR